MITQGQVGSFFAYHHSGQPTHIANTSRDKGPSTPSDPTPIDFHYQQIGVGVFLKMNGKTDADEKGHPVFIAQHATASCCRGCLWKWYSIEKRSEVRLSEFRFPGLMVAPSLIGGSKRASFFFGISIFWIDP